MGGDGESRNEGDGSGEVLARGGVEGKLLAIEVVACALSSSDVTRICSGKSGESAAILRGCLIILVFMLSRLAGGLAESIGDD